MEKKSDNEGKEESTNNDSDYVSKPPPQKRQKLNFESPSNVDRKRISSTSLDSDDDEEQDIDVKNDNSKKNALETKTKVNRNEIIRLNVGGVKYLTTRGTLLNFKDKTGHMLSAMFSGDYLSTPTINNNEYFIDRNGKYFEYILSFLRNGNQFIDNMLPHLSKDIILNLKLESKYFGLYNLIFDRFYAPVRWNPQFYCCHNTLHTKIAILGGDRCAVCETQRIPIKWIDHGRKISTVFKQFLVEKSIAMKKNKLILSHDKDKSKENDSKDDQGKKGNKNKKRDKYRVGYRFVCDDLNFNGDWCGGYMIGATKNCLYVRFTIDFENLALVYESSPNNENTQYTHIKTEPFGFQQQWKTSARIQLHAFFDETMFNIQVECC